MDSRLEKYAWLLIMVKLDFVQENVTILSNAGQ
jgi:hypothetical protein